MCVCVRERERERERETERDRERQRERERERAFVDARHDWISLKWHALPLERERGMWVGERVGSEYEGE